MSDLCSRGQFYEKHLKFIKLNEHYVPFTKKNMTYLRKVSATAFRLNNIHFVIMPSND